MEKLVPEPNDSFLSKIKCFADNVTDPLLSLTSTLKTLLKESSPPKKFDIDEGASFYTQGIDDIILSEQKNNALLYVGGQLKLQYIDENSFLLKLDLYFQDASKKWVKQCSQETGKLKYLTPQAVQELHDKREITFEIEPPKEKHDL